MRAVTAAILVVSARREHLRARRHQAVPGERLDVNVVAPSSVADALDVPLPRRRRRLRRVGHRERDLRAAAAQVEHRDGRRSIFRAAAAVLEALPDADAAEEVVHARPRVLPLVLAAHHAHASILDVETGPHEFLPRRAHDRFRRLRALREKTDPRGRAERQLGPRPHLRWHLVARDVYERVERVRGDFRALRREVSKPRRLRRERLRDERHAVHVGRELEDVHAVARAARVEDDDARVVRVRARVHRRRERERERDDERERDGDLQRAWIGRERRPPLRLVFLPRGHRADALVRPRPRLDGQRQHLPREPARGVPVHVGRRAPR
mmetsp:Transcript_10881/g.39392  ORF Transcript_10881/g.39392 Transcript_10881/m.39392 type:complete len:325 (-) Transcript_10881:21-995(-)